MCYERRRAEACVDESAHHALVNAVHLAGVFRTGFSLKKREPGTGPMSDLSTVVHEHLTVVHAMEGGARKFVMARQRGLGGA